MLNTTTRPLVTTLQEHCAHTHTIIIGPEREKRGQHACTCGVSAHTKHTHNTAKHTLETLTHTHTHTRICMDTHTQKY